MKEQFCSYLISLKFKELGFNEECFSVYDELGFLQQEKEMNELNLSFTLAPLWQQVEEWLRNKHNIHIEIRNYQEYQKDNYAYALNFTKDSNYLDKDKNKVGKIISRIYYDYEEARKQAILKCIELLKNK